MSLTEDERHSQKVSSTSLMRMHYIMSRISRAVIARCCDSLATTYITLNSVKNGTQLWVFLLQLHILQRHTWTLLMHHQQSVSIVGDTCKELNVVLVLYILQRGSLLLFIYLFFFILLELYLCFYEYIKGLLYDHAFTLTAGSLRF